VGNGDAFPTLYYLPGAERLHQLVLPQLLSNRLAQSAGSLAVDQSHYD
jgi:hypothetical protein